MSDDATTPHASAPAPGEAQRIQPEYHSSEARLAAMDAQGIEFSWILPSLGLGLEEMLDEKARATIQALDLAPAREFLQEDWGRRTLAGWTHHKFGLAIDPATGAFEPT